MQPNTLEAHRLITWAQAQGDLDAVSALVERLFHAYFIEGSFLGDREELTAINRLTDGLQHLQIRPDAAGAQCLESTERIGRSDDVVRV